MRAHERDDHRAARVIVVATIVVLVAPVLVDLIASGRKRIFAYLASDSFYYLQVARNVVQHGSVSFDGRRATNGFHPLWQAVLSGEQGISSALGLGRTPMLYVSILTGLAVLVGAVILIAATLRAGHMRLTPLFVILPVGFYAVLFAPVWVGSGALGASGINPFEGPMPIYGTLWSYANGMETPFVLGTFALVAYLVTTRPFAEGRAGILIGVALALLVLARLDSVPIALAVIAAFAASAVMRRDRPGFRAAGVATAVVAGVLVAYLIVNHLYAGAWLPVSGTLKSTFPRPTLGNWRDLRSLLEHPTALGPLRWYRQFPMVVPAAIAAVFLTTARLPTLLRASPEEPRVRYRLLLTGTAAGVIAVSAYDFFFVPNYNQGFWYYPVSTLLVSLLALEWLSRWHLETRAVLVAGVCAVLSLVLFMTLGRRADYHIRLADFYYDGAPSLVASYRHHVPLLLEADDGIDLYSLGAEGISGIGLMLDHDAVNAFHNDRLLQLAVARGFDRIVSLNYLDASGLTTRTSPDLIRLRVARFLARPEHAPPDLSGYDFSVERRLPPGSIAREWPGTDGSYVVIRVRRHS